MKKIYFAHPMCTYNTISEEFFLENLKLKFPDAEILNPNQVWIQEECEKLEDAMSYFKDLTQSCDLLIAMPFADNTLGAGVGKEIEWMWEKDGDVVVYPITAENPVYLPKNTFFDFKVLTREETRAKMLSYKFGTYVRK